MNNTTSYWKPHPDVVEMSLKFCLENQRPGLKILINLRLKVRCVQFLMLINVVAVTFQLMWMTCNTSLSHAGMVFRLDTRTGHWLEKLSNIFSVTKIFYFLCVDIVRSDPSRVSASDSLQISFHQRVTEDRMSDCHQQPPSQQPAQLTTQGRYHTEDTDI